MKNFLIQFTVGQMVFIVLCLAAGAFVDFYLGARFGPQIFWGIPVERLREEPLLPGNLSDAELEALLKAEADIPLVFHQELERTGKDAKILPSKAVVGGAPSVRPPASSAKAALAAAAEPRAEVLSTVGDAGATGPTTPSPPPPPPPAGKYSLQVGSYGSLKEAEVARTKFERAGYSVAFQTENIPGKGLWYRVRVGRYPTLQEAEAGKNLLKKNHGAPAVVVKLP